MAKYEIVFKRSVYKDLRPIPKVDVRRILSKINLLADEPRQAGCEKLSGSERYRIRQGIYRIIYEIEDKKLIINVVKIGHRRQIYER